MLTIRKNQIDALEARLSDTFVRQTQNLLNRACPAACAHLDDAVVQARILKGLQQAAEHGITDEGHQIRFVQLMVMFDTDRLGASAETAWAQNILAWEGAESGLLVAALEKRARQALADLDGSQPSLECLYD